MKKNIIVIDDFYQNALEVREYILKQDFNVEGNYPGKRTRSFANEYLKEWFEQLMGMKISYWDGGYNGSYQYTLKDQKSWVHRDQTDYACVVYLTPDAPLESGTAFFKHNETQLEFETEEATDEQIELLDNDSSDLSKWTMTDKICNKFNRAIIFNGRRSHSSMEYFGDSLENGRLFQLFFFDAS